MAGTWRAPEPMDAPWRDLPPAPPYDDVRLRVLVARHFQLDRRWQDEHRHDPFDRLYHITDGSGELVSATGTVVMKPGFTYLIPAFTVHRHRCASSLTLYWAHVITRFSGERGLFDEVPGIHARPSEHLRTIAIFERLCAACCGEGPAAILQRQSCALDLLTPFLDLLENRDDPERQRFRPVLAAIDAGTGDGVCGIARLAAIAGLSPDHFTRRFSAVFGTSPARYRSRRRLAMAQRLLAEGDQSVDAVARACGFCDGFHLSKVFRRLLGTTPSAYRCRQRNP